MAFFITRKASAASKVGTVERMISQPASSSVRICAIVAAAFSVFVFVMDCTAIGFPPPITREPI